MRSVLVISVGKQGHTYGRNITAGYILVRFDDGSGSDWFDRDDLQYLDPDPGPCAMDRSLRYSLIQRGPRE